MAYLRKQSELELMPSATKEAVMGEVRVSKENKLVEEEEFDLECPANVDNPDPLMSVVYNGTVFNLPEEHQPLPTLGSHSVPASSHTTTNIPNMTLAEGNADTPAVSFHPGPEKVSSHF